MRRAKARPTYSRFLISIDDYHSLAGCSESVAEASPRRFCTEALRAQMQRRLHAQTACARVEHHSLRGIKNSRCLSSLQRVLVGPRRSGRAGRAA